MHVSYGAGLRDGPPLHQPFPLNSVEFRVYTSQCCPQHILPLDVWGLFLQATLYLPTAISSEPPGTFHICVWPQERPKCPWPYQISGIPGDAPIPAQNPLTHPRLSGPARKVHISTCSHVQLLTSYSSELTHLPTANILPSHCCPSLSPPTAAFKNM